MMVLSPQAEREKEKCPRGKGRAFRNELLLRRKCHNHDKRTSNPPLRKKKRKIPPDVLARNPHRKEESYGIKEKKRGERTLAIMLGKRSARTDRPFPGRGGEV